MDIIIDTDSKVFTVKVGMLSTFALITQALGIGKGSQTPNTDFVGDLTWDQLLDVARRKREGVLAASLKAAVREIVGSCQSMGVTVEEKPAGEVQVLIGSGEYDAKLSEAA